MNGQYLFLDGWKRISRVIDANAAVISQNASATGMADTPVVTMNEFHIEGENVALTRFEIAYIPRV